jgi:hypothetical protein
MELAGNVGAVVPAQKGGIPANVGMKIGFDNTTPVKRFVVHPLISNEKLEYIPAFNPLIITWPDALATIFTGPTGVPSSV